MIKDKIIPAQGGFSFGSKRLNVPEYAQLWNEAKLYLKGREIEGVRPFEYKPQVITDEILRAERIQQEIAMKLDEWEQKLIEKTIRAAFDQLPYEFTKCCDKVTIVHSANGCQSYYINHGAEYEFLILQIDHEMLLKHKDGKVIAEIVYKTPFKTEK